MPGDRTPFRKQELGDEAAAAAYHNDHDLREMYSRENTERRRAGAHTLRKHLTGAQDRALTAKMVKIRDEYDVSNNDDVVVVFCQLLIAEGKSGELSPKLLEAVANARIPKRSRPFA